MKPMTVTKVDARRDKNITFNEVLNKPLNNPDWIDTTEANRSFDKVQKENINQGDYVYRHKPDLNIIPSRLVYFGLKES